MNEMNDRVISIAGLSKSYLVGHEATQERYSSLRDNVVRAARNLFRKTTDMLRGRQIVQGDEVEQFWALRDVSFEVHRGEVIGIIGRNGAGKSTLLKILSRITEATEGRVVLGGRVASLLEVGTGFHPELTGRENVFLNGTILGMTRAEIRSKFDEIIAFAGVAKFLDTPVKRYSSGMYLRLAFAVAAHLEPEVMIVDEVLAVGDQEFQNKCLGKMSEIACNGRTVIFVSHNIAAIRRLCTRALWIDSGRIVSQGMVDTVVDAYLSGTRMAASGIPLHRRLDRTGNGAARIISMNLYDEEGMAIRRIRAGEGMVLEIEYAAAVPLLSVCAHVALYNSESVAATYLSSRLTNDLPSQLPKKGRIVCRVPRIDLTIGEYNINVCLEVEGREADHIMTAAKITVTPSDFFPSGTMPPPAYGVMLSRQEWSVRRVD